MMLLEKTANQVMMAMVLLLHGCGDATTLCRNISARRRSGPRLAFRGCGVSASRRSRSTVAFSSSNDCSLLASNSGGGRVLWSKAGQASSNAPLGRLCSSGIMKHPLPRAAGAERQRRRRRAAPAVLKVGAAEETAVPTVATEKESNDGSQTPLSKAAQAYYDRKRAAMRDWTQERQSRDLCSRCQRARQTCLCSSLPAEAVPTSTRFIILQHPTEHKKRVTGTVPLVLHCLSNCRRVVVRYDYSKDDLREILGVSAGGVGGNKGSPLLLFPFPDAEYLEDVAASREDEREASSLSTPPRRQSPPPRDATAAASADDAGGTASSPSLPSAQQAPPAALLGPTTVVVIDGTWSQAKQILARYPFLTPERTRSAQTTVAPAAASTGASGGDSARAHRGGDGRLGNEENQDAGQARSEDGLCFRPVKFRSAGVSSYGFRREPAKECLSTLESVAYTLEVLEATPQGVSAAGHLRKAFAAMVAMQVEAADAAGGNPRFVNRKGRTANRRLTPKKDRNGG
ncbi:unnamed protein product [Scytosiphon promiscuus]